MVWPLVSLPCSSGWLYTHEYMKSTNWNQWTMVRGAEREGMRWGGRLT